VENEIKNILTFLFTSFHFHQIYPWQNYWHYLANHSCSHCDMVGWSDSITSIKRYSYTGNKKFRLHEIYSPNLKHTSGSKYWYLLCKWKYNVDRFLLTIWDSKLLICSIQVLNMILQFTELTINYKYNLSFTTVNTNHNHQNKKTIITECVLHVDLTRYLG
jgi:hypothetical protein